MDTVSDVMNKLEPELLESCRRHIIKYLLDKRAYFADTMPRVSEQTVPLSMELMPRVSEQTVPLSMELI